MQLDRYSLFTVSREHIKTVWMWITESFVMQYGNRDYLQNHSPRVSTSRNGAPWLQLEVTWRFWIGFGCTIRSWTGGIAIISINKHYQPKCQLQHQDMSLVVRFEFGGKEKKTTYIFIYSCQKPINLLLSHIHQGRQEITILYNIEAYSQLCILDSFQMVIHSSHTFYIVYKHRHFRES